MNPSYTMNEKITIQDLANLLAEKHGIQKKEAELFIKGMFDLVEEALATEKYVKIKGLGVFKLTEVDSRESINVNTGERIEIQGHTKISFTPDASLKELINKPFSHFETVILNEGVELEDTKEEPEAVEVAGDESETMVEVAAVEETVVIETAVVEKEESDVVTEEEIPETKVEELETIVEESEVMEEVLPVAEEETTTVTEEEPVVMEHETHHEEVEPVVEVEESDKEISDEKDDMEEGEDTEEVVVEEKVETETVAEPSVAEKEKEEVPGEEKTSKGLVFITILLVLIILGGLYWLFQSKDDKEDAPVKTEPIEVIDTVSDDKVNVGQVADTIIAENTASSSEAKKSEPIVPEEKVASLADTTAYSIIGTKTTHTLQNGETIIRVAVKYFGAKNFWPYIAKHNEKSIKNANNVPVGTKLLIPELAPKK